MSKKLKTVLLVIWLSQLAEWIYFIAINLKVFQLTQVAWSVSLLYLSQYVIGFFFHPLIGRLVDRFNPKTFFIIVNIIRSIFVFALVTTGNLFNIYCLIFLIQLASLFNETITVALSSKLVETNKLESFNVWRGFATSSAVIIGPALSGTLLFNGNLALPIVVNGILLIISIILMSLIRMPSGEKKLPIKMKCDSALNENELKIQLPRSFIKLIYFGIGIIAAIDSIEAVFLTEVNGFSPSNYSLILGVAGLGAIVSAIIQIKFSLGKHRNEFIHVASIVTAISYLYCSWQNTFPSFLFCFFLLSFTLNYLQTNILTVIQFQTNSNSIGKVMSRYYLIESISGMVCIIFIGIGTLYIEIRMLYRVASIVLLVIFCCSAIHYVDKRWKKCDNNKSNFGNAN